MGTFRARPEWMGDKMRERQGRPRRTDSTTLPPAPASRRAALTPEFGVGRPWRPKTRYEREQGHPLEVAAPCGADRHGQPCGRPRQADSAVCGQCGIDIARAVFLDNDRHRDWCAEQITTEEYERGEVRVATSLREQRRQRAVEREATAEHVVYYLRTAPDQIKIGTTSNLPQRLRGLYTDPSYLLAVEPGGRELERKRHLEFGRWNTHTHREAFLEVPELVARIEAVVNRHGPPMSFLHRPPSSEEP